MNISSKQLCQQKKSSNREYEFNVGMAIKYGVKAAILIQYFQNSIYRNKINGLNFYEGRYWTYNSLTDLVSLYPYWTKSIIRGIIKNLKAKNVIITGNFNKNRHDRTTWYAFTNEDNFLDEFLSEKDYYPPKNYHHDH